MAVPIRPFVDRILGGNLTDFLRAARAEGLSYERMARKLLDLHRVDVSASQVRKWCLEDDRAAADDSGSAA